VTRTYTSPKASDEAQPFALGQHVHSILDQSSFEYPRILLLFARVARCPHYFDHRLHLATNMFEVPSLRLLEHDTRVW